MIIQNIDYQQSQQVKQCGFQCPWHLMQVLSWILFIFKISFYYLFFLQFFNDEEKIILITLFSLSSVLVLLFAIISTAIDPSDQNVYLERLANQRGEVLITSLHRFCTICLAHVEEKTKHCGQCNRCVSDFDHHCRWLNNCIGKRNYKYFILLLCSLFCMSVISNVTSITNFVQFMQGENYDFKQKLKNHWLNLNEQKYLAIIIITYIPDPFILFFVLDIITYHMWLYNKNLSTYDHILMKRQKQVEQLRIATIQKRQSKVIINHNDNIPNADIKHADEIQPAQNECEMGSKDYSTLTLKNNEKSINMQALQSNNVDQNNNQEEYKIDKNNIQAAPVVKLKSKNLNKITPFNDNDAKQSYNQENLLQTQHSVKQSDIPNLNQKNSQKNDQIKIDQQQIEKKSAYFNKNRNEDISFQNAYDIKDSKMQGSKNISQLEIDNSQNILNNSKINNPDNDPQLVHDQFNQSIDNSICNTIQSNQDKTQQVFINKLYNHNTIDVPQTNSNFSSLKNQVLNQSNSNNIDQTMNEMKDFQNSNIQ